MMILIAYFCFLSALTYILKSPYDGHGKPPYKAVVSIVHSSILWNVVLRGVKYDLNIIHDSDMMTSIDYRYISLAHKLGITYILVDSFVYPVRMDRAMITHHIVTVFGSLYGIYDSIEVVTYLSFLGEIFSVFLHLRNLVYEWLKLIMESCTVIVFIVARLYTPVILWRYVWEHGGWISCMFYGTYIILNWYWGLLIAGKVYDKIR